MHRMCVVNLVSPMMIAIVASVESLCHTLKKNFYLKNIFIPLFNLNLKQYKTKYFKLFISNSV